MDHLVGKSLMSIIFNPFVGLFVILREDSPENSIPKFCLKSIILAASILGASYEKVVGLDICLVHKLALHSLGFGTDSLCFTPSWEGI